MDPLEVEADGCELNGGGGAEASDLGLRWQTSEHGRLEMAVAKKQRR